MSVAVPHDIFTYNPSEHKVHATHTLSVLPPHGASTYWPRAHGVHAEHPDTFNTHTNSNTSTRTKHTKKAECMHVALQYYILYDYIAHVVHAEHTKYARANTHTYRHICTVHGDENTFDALMCRSLSASEPFVIGPFYRTSHSQIRHLMYLCHPKHDSSYKKPCPYKVHKNAMVCDYISKDYCKHKLLLTCAQTIVVYYCKLWVRSGD